MSEGTLEDHVPRRESADLPRSGPATPIVMPGAGRKSSHYPYRHFGGFRFLLALSVLLQHYVGDLAPESLARQLLPYQFGGMAVLVFFALSGFGIVEVVDRVYSQRARAFFSNRLLRILPHFLLAVALSMAAHALFRASGAQGLWRLQPDFPREAFAWGNVLLNFTSIVPGADRLLDYNFLDITWTVRVEMAFYLLVTACILLGRHLPVARGFAWVLVAAALALLPMFLLAMAGRGIPMLAFLPHFVFGGALYYAGQGKRAARWLLAACLPVMFWHAVHWQYLLLPVISAVPGAGPPLIGLNLLVFAILLSAMAWLALSEFTQGRKLDRLFGQLTYPLYLYHEVVLVVLLTFTDGYRYSILCAGIAASLLVAWLLARVVDPGIDRARDRIRGRAR